MKKLILHNLKKARGQFISFGVVMMITAIILNTALVLLFQTSSAYDTLFDELNTADFSVAVPSFFLRAESQTEETEVLAADCRKDISLSDDTLLHDILELDGISGIDTQEALFAPSVLQDFNHAEFTMNAFFYRINDERKLTRHIILEQAENTDETGVYIPLYLAELGGYRTGGNIRYVIDGREYSFLVEGILCEMQYGNYGTGFIGLYLTDGAYDRLKKDEAFTSVREYLIKAEEQADFAKIRKALGTLLKERNISALSILDGRTTKGSRTMVSNTIVLFLAVFAALVLLVSIFLSRFRIKTAIDEEINEMGVLKGIGYTSRMLKFSQVIPYLLVCGAGIICGLALSYALVPVIANVLAIQSGFSYTPVFDVPAAFITVLFILLTVFLFTFLAAGKIKRLEPINAIRGIDPLKPVGKNLFALDSAKGSVGFYLMCKQAGMSGSRNILLFAVAYAMMILLAFTSILLYNINVHPDNFLTTLSEELPDIRVLTNEEKQDGLKKILEKEKIKTVNYGAAMAEYADGSIPVIVCEDFFLLENDIAYSGRHPWSENEIAIGNKFENDYEIGDKFTLSLYGRQYEYVITGFIQSVNNNGLIAEITDAGYLKIFDSPLYSLNLYLSEDADISLFVDKLKGEYGDYVISVSNAAKEAESMQRMYSSLITVVAIALFVITALIILLILYVIFHSMIVGMKTDFGICKAIGFIGRQLTYQTVGSIVPAVLLGALSSAVCGIFYLPVMLDGIFGVIGAVKNNFEIPPYLLFAMAAILTMVNVVTGVLLCRPIKRISAYTLIKE